MDKKFFSFSISKGLYDLAYNIGNVFGSIFFYQLFGGSIVAAMCSFAATNLVYITFLLLLVKKMGGFGIRNNLIISHSLFMLAFLVFSFVDKSRPLPFLIIWVILFGLARTFYHIPYTMYVLDLSNPQSRGDSLGKHTAMSTLATMFMPLLGGTISTMFGIRGTALFSAMVFLLSIIPLLSLPNIKFHYTGNLLKMFNMNSTRKSLRLTVTNEVENKGRVWQIYVFLLLQSNFMNFGLLLTFVNFICFAFSWFFGKFMDHSNRLKIMKFDSLITGLLWFTRPFVNTPLAITINNSIFDFVANSRNQVVSLIDFDYLKRSGDEPMLDEQLVAREVGWNILSAVLLGIMTVIVLLLGWQASFIFSGLAAISMLAFN